MTTCGYEFVKCENDCRDDDGETVKILRKDLETHLQEECPNRTYNVSIAMERASII